MPNEKPVKWASSRALRAKSWAWSRDGLKRLKPGRRDRPKKSKPGRVPDSGKPMSNLTIVLWAIGLLAVGAAAVWILVVLFGGGSDSDKQRLDVVRTAGTIVVGTGGVAALYLAARRQQSAERTLEHQREVAASNELDARERRVSEQYTKAADQLGSEKAPVRMAGLYALERLANAEVDQRQTIINLYCAYLRMPYVPPSEGSPATEEDPEAFARHQERVQEREVRLAVQAILRGRLDRSDSGSFWPGLSLRLQGAVLENFGLPFCRVGSVNFHRARFIGTTTFLSAEFEDFAIFDGAKFLSRGNFDEGTFLNTVSFTDTDFEAGASFRYVRFSGITGLASAKTTSVFKMNFAKVFVRDAQHPSGGVPRHRLHMYALPGWRVVQLGQPENRAFEFIRDRDTDPVESGG